MTGAARGIGYGCALELAKAGADVAINDVAPGEQAEEVARAIREIGRRATIHQADVSARDAVTAMVEAVVAAHGRLDILVNNAGVYTTEPFLEISDSWLQRILDVDLKGVILTGQAAARQMVRQGPGGKLVFISSVHEDIPFPEYTAYCASKGGIRMMMRNLAMELAPHKINCNNIAPGAIATPINQKVLDDPEQKKNAISEIPWGRFGRPEEVAGVAVFLASDEADYVTGSTYYIDGGLTQQVTKY